jgi:hypothetical protein
MAASAGKGRGFFSGSLSTSVLDLVPDHHPAYACSRLCWGLLCTVDVHLLWHLRQKPYILLGFQKIRRGGLSFHGSLDGRSDDVAYLSLLIYGR